MRLRTRPLSLTDKNIRPTNPKGSMTVTTRSARACAGTSAALAALALTACSSATTDPSPTSAARATSTSPAPATSATTSQPTGAASDLTFTCTPEAGQRWVFKGTVRNSTGTASTYTVNVSIVAKAGSTVLASASKSVTVQPKASAPVQIGPLDPKVAPDTAACVPLTTVKR